jgi:hypothetical protein
MADRAAQPVTVTYAEPLAHTGDTFWFCPGFVVEQGQQRVGMVAVRLTRTAHRLLLARVPLPAEEVDARLPPALVAYGTARVEQLVGDPEVVADVRSMPQAYTDTINSADEDALTALASLIADPPGQP